MAEATKSDDIGMKRGRAIGQLTPDRQLDIIAEGLPILFKSADALLTAAEALDGHDRAASILQGHATEELAKILIGAKPWGMMPTVTPEQIAEVDAREKAIRSKVRALGIPDADY